MKALLIGGTGFIGPHVARLLVAQGHQVAVFHRDRADPALPEGVKHLIGDRNALAESASQFRVFAPDVTIDFILSSERQARDLMNAMRGTVSRVVALSSGDVYRAAAILHRLDDGPLQPVPLTEESELRRNRNPYPPESLATLRNVFNWLDDDYDKIPVEQVVMSDSEIRGTVLRLPMIYGPGDPLHRLHPILKRIDDRRPAILMQEEAAQWRGLRGYVENVGAAIALAAASPQATGRVYNVAEIESYSELEWAQHIGRIAGWKGRVIALPKEQTPPHLQIHHNAAQHWTASSARIRQELGYAESIPLDTALERTIAWERANPPSADDPKQFDYAAEDIALASK
ncbi:MAG TPA: NAD-dependent epimerase/dehydratase family protein [Bryobacteraceae bacterium]|nr:NAD-dependent epimerase/dehydratase family protein [Bryobacteraceae bacterium]